MRIFIDDSGDFGWATPQISLYCGVIVCVSSLVDLYRRHLLWKTSIVGPHRQREIKGSSLTDEQLESFARVVICPERHLKLTVVGMDTSLVPKAHLEKWRDGISHLCQGVAAWSDSNSLPIAGKQYREMSGWFWNRSPENLAQLLSLAALIWECFQNSIIYFHEPEFEPEFDDLEIVMDMSFIKRPEHEVFWREFFRTYATNRSRREPLGIPEAWKEGGHIFEKKYFGSDSEVNMTPLFRQNMYFLDSKLSEGLQIADICANICSRYHRRKRSFEAYRLLQRFMVGPDHGRMTALVPLGDLDVNSTPPTERQKEVFEHARQLKVRTRKR
jgi:hypothetical protein